MKSLTEAQLREMLEQAHRLGWDDCRQLAIVEREQGFKKANVLRCRLIEQSKEKFKQMISEV